MGHVWCTWLLVARAMGMRIAAVEASASPTFADVPRVNMLYLASASPQNAIRIRYPRWPLCQSCGYWRAVQKLPSVHLKLAMSKQQV
ncbi:hypothetical protein OSTOST_20807 [Ostertagia ostertagi]